MKQVLRENEEVEDLEKHLNKQRLPHSASFSLRLIFSVNSVVAYSPRVSVTGKYQILIPIV